MRQSLCRLQGVNRHWDSPPYKTPARTSSSWVPVEAARKATLGSGPGWRWSIESGSGFPVFSITDTAPSVEGDLLIGLRGGYGTCGARLLTRTSCGSDDGDWDPLGTAHRQGEEKDQARCAGLGVK